MSWRFMKLKPGASRERVFSTSEMKRIFAPLARIYWFLTLRVVRITANILLAGKYLE